MRLPSTLASPPLTSGPPPDPRHRPAIAGAAGQGASDAEGRRRFLRAVAPMTASAALLLAGAPAARAQGQSEGVELVSLGIDRNADGLMLDFTLRLQPSRAVEEALQRGVPVTFVARADVFQPRWYWRDRRVARAQRVWRVSWQPLMGQWRVSLGGLAQHFDTLDAALGSLSRAYGWQIADGNALPADEAGYVEFSYRLDSSQLPRPMQLDLGAQSDWRLELERAVEIPAAP